MTPKCTSWLGHKFEGRYSERSGLKIKLDEGHPTPEMIEASKGFITYERDICVRCGATVEKVK